MPHQIEHLTPNVTRERLAEGRIVLFGLRGAAREDADMFVATVKEVIGVWDPKQPFLVMYDASQSYLTPYTRQCIVQVGDAIPLGVRGRTAILLPQGILFRIGLSFIRNYVPVQNSAMQREFFLVREKAIDWLIEGLE